MDKVTSDYFDSLEADLRAKKDRSEELDELFQMSFLGEEDVRDRTSWCVAKMGQNKVPDMRILDIQSDPLRLATGAPSVRRMPKTSISHH